MDRKNFIKSSIFGILSLFSIKGLAKSRDDTDYSDHIRSELGVARVVKMKSGRYIIYIDIRKLDFSIENIKKLSSKYEQLVDKTKNPGLLVPLPNEYQKTIDGFSMELLESL